MIYCHNCGFQNTDDTRFCVSCGTALAGTDPVQDDLNKTAYAGTARNFSPSPEAQVNSAPVVTTAAASSLPAAPAANQPVNNFNNGAQMPQNTNAPHINRVSVAPLKHTYGERTVKALRVLLIIWSCIAALGGIASGVAMIISGIEFEAIGIMLGGLGIVAAGAGVGFLFYFLGNIGIIQYENISYIAKNTELQGNIAQAQLELMCEMMNVQSELSRSTSALNSAVSGLCVDRGSGDPAAAKQTAESLGTLGAQQNQNNLLLQRNIALLTEINEQMSRFSGRASAADESAAGWRGELAEMIGRRFDSLERSQQNSMEGLTERLCAVIPVPAALTSVQEPEDEASDAAEPQEQECRVVPDEEYGVEKTKGGLPDADNYESSAMTPENIYAPVDAADAAEEAAELFIKETTEGPDEVTSGGGDEYRAQELSLDENLPDFGDMEATIVAPFYSDGTSNDAE